jgi:hypothetical protein
MELWKPDLNLGSQRCHHEKIINFIPWIQTRDPSISCKYFVTGPSKQDIKGSYKSILVPFRTIKDCHFCWSLLLVWQIFSLNWDLHINSFVGTLCIWLWWSNVKILITDAGLPGSNPGCEVWYFFMLTSLGDWFKSGFHSTFWDFTSGIWNWGMASSF